VNAGLIGNYAFCFSERVRSISSRSVRKLNERTFCGRPRDPEDRKIDESSLVEKKDKMMDKTVADTFPASDPPSSLPDPDEDSFAA